MDQLHRMENNIMWTLEEAFVLIRKLQPIAFKTGYNLTLGGGVLNNGFSHNDLDLVAIPRGNDIPTNWTDLAEAIEGQWKRGWLIRNPSRHIEQYRLGNGKILELIVLES
jgi:hypothetical protein